MSKKRLIDDDELRKGVEAHLAQKKKQEPQGSSPRSSPPSGGGGINSPDELSNVLDPNTGNAPFDFSQDVVDRSMQNSEGASPVELTLGNNRPSDLGYRAPGLNSAITDQLNSDGQYQSPVEKQKSDQLNRMADIYDRVSGKGTGIEKARESDIVNDNIDQKRKRDGSFFGDLGAALNSGIDQMAVIAGSIPAATIDLAGKRNPFQDSGLGILADWIKDLKVGDGNSKASEYFTSVINSPLDFQRKLEEATVNDLDAEKLGQLAEKTVGLPEEYNPLSPNNYVVKEFSERAKSNEELAHQNYSGGIVQAIQDGNYKDAGKLTAIGITQSMPLMVGLMLSRGAGASEITSLGALGVGTTGQSYRELKDENPNLDPNLMYVNAILTGVSEAGSELLGANLIYNQGRKLFKAGLKKEADEVIRTGIKGYVDQAFKKSFAAAAALDEGSTEAVNQIVKNAIDKWTGVKPDVDYTDGALEAFIIGVGAGATVSIPFHAASKVAKLANKNSVRAAITENESIAPFLLNPNLNPAVKERLLDQQSKNIESINDAIDSDAAQAAVVLNTKEVGSVSTINNKIDEKESVIADPEMPEPIKEVAKATIQQLEKQADDILTNAEGRYETITKLNQDVTLADTPEKIAKIINKATEVALPGDPLLNELTDAAKEKMAKIRTQEEKQSTPEKPINDLRKEMMDDIDAELDALKVEVKPDPIVATPVSPKTVEETTKTVQSPVPTAEENGPEKTKYLSNKPTTEKAYATDAITKKPVELTDINPVDIGITGDFYSHKALKGDGFVISEGQTGTRVAEGQTVEEAIESAKSKVSGYIKKNGEDAFYALLNNQKSNLTSPSPRYAPVSEKTESSVEKTKKSSDKTKTESVQSLSMIYDTTGFSEKNVTEIGNNYPQTKLKKDVTNFSKALASKLGLKHDSITKGKTTKEIFANVNVPPAGGDASFYLWKPNSDYGVYINYSIDRNQDTDVLSVKPQLLWRITKKSDKYRGMGNNYTSSESTVDQLAEKIDRELSKYDNVKPTIPNVENASENVIISSVPNTDSVLESDKRSIKDKISTIKNEELTAAKKAFFDTFKNINSGINPETLDKGLKLMAVYTKLGIYKFADIVSDIATEVGDKLPSYFDSLKAAYGAFATQQATDEQLDQMDDIRSVRKEKVEDYITPNTTENESTRSELNTVDANAPAVPAGEQTITPDGALPVEEIETIPVGQDAGGGEIGSPVINQQQADTGGNTGRSAAVDSDAQRGNDGSGSNADTRSNIRENRAERSVSEEDRNHSIADNDIIVPAGKVGKFTANLDAIFLLNKLDKEGRNPSPAEKKVLAQYVGWGGLSSYLENSSYNDDAQAVDAYLNGKSAFVRKGGSYMRSSLDFSQNDAVNISGFGSAADLISDIKNALAKEGYSITPESIRPSVLRSLLTDQEYNAARTSTVSSHFTDRNVVSKMWSIAEQLGFKGGRILESSAGIGNILGLMPDNLQNKTSITGYELDNLTGRMLAKLYPQSNIVVDGFENAKIPLNSMDLVITNVPFGRTAPYDRLYSDLSKFSLHNYFLAKNLKMLKPGGLGVMISSSSTMDAGASAKFREWVTDPSGGNSVLVGAIRLPNNAFAENAGTEVTTDILIFQKRGTNDLSNIAQDFRYAKFLKEGADGYGDPVKIDVNEYYINNPDNMLGEMMTANEAGSGGLYGNSSAPTLVAPENFDITSAMNAAIDRLPSNITDPNNQVSENIQDEDSAVNAVDKKEGSLFEKNGKVWQVNNGEGTPVQFEGKQAAIAKEYISVKKELLDLIQLEQQDGVQDGVIDAQRAELNKQYDEYVKKHGFINAKNSAFLEDFDIDFPIAVSLEHVTRSLEKGPNGRDRAVQTITKGEILKSRVNFPRIEPTTANNIKDAIDISLNYRNNINEEFIGKLMNEDPEVIKDRLINDGLAFENPDTGLLESPDEYLSGYVRDKMMKAEIAATNDPRYRNNVEQLSKVIPEDIPSSLIQYTIGAAWIPPGIFQDFAKSIFDADLNIQYIPTSGRFLVNVTRGGYNTQIQNTYAAGGKTGVDILTATLNNQQIVITDTVLNENKNKVQRKNPEKTAAAQAMQEQLQDEFQSFIRDNETAQAETERIYNDVFNGQVLRDYRIPETKHYPGASTEITLRQHQKKAVSRGLAESTLFAHQVGSGKTFTIITTAMEMRRLGTANKPMIVVQNATRGQFITAYRKLYPAAKILAPSEKELSAEGRRRFFAKMATGDWDSIIIPQSQLSMIPDDPQRQSAYIQEQIDEMQSILSQIDKRSSPFEYRQMEKEIKTLQKEYTDLTEESDEEGPKKRGGKSAVKTGADRALSIEANMRKVLDRKTDNIFNFEELGIDALLIDEAHAYKRLGFNTQMKNIKGIDTSKSKRSQSVLLKTSWVQEKTGGKNVLLYTGTPISNTMAEAWTMMKYVRPDILEHMGIEHFDQFAKTFGQVIPSLEQTGGGTYKIQNRFAKFQNLPEFINAFRAATDVVLSEDVVEFQQEDTLPKLKDGKMTQVVVQQTPELKKQISEFKKTLEWFEKLTGSAKRENSHIPLVIFNKAKQASIDLRLLDPTNVDSPNSKVNQVVKDALKQYHETTGVQMIFSDMYQSPEPKDRFLDEDEMVPNPAFGQPRFNLFNDIKAKLIAGGVKENEIAILTEARYDKPERKEQLFEQANSGKIRFLLGSTERMGVGVNAQQKMVGLSHIDAPARPMDFEQRNGRIIRQGNENKTVDVRAYGVERTLDSAAFQRLSTKQKFINQIMKGENLERVTEDPADEAQMTFDEMMAHLSDSPYAMQKLMVDNKLKSEKTKRDNFNGKLIQTNTRLKFAQRELAELKGKLSDDKRFAQIAADHFPEGNITEVVASKVTHTEKFSAAVIEYVDMLHEKYKTSPTLYAKGAIKVNGIQVEMEFVNRERMSSKTKLMYNQPELYYTVPEIGIVENAYGNGVQVESMTGNGLMTSLRFRIENVIGIPAKTERQIQFEEASITELQKNVNLSFDDSKLKALEAESELLKNKMINESNNNPEDDPDGGGIDPVQTDSEYILDQSNVKPILDALDSMKISNSGKMYTSIVPIPPAVWNGAIEAMKAIIKVTNSTQKGIRVAAKYISNNGGSKAQVMDFMQTMNNKYGPGTPLASKLETLTTKINEAKTNLKSKVDAISNDGITDYREIKTRLVAIMQDARKTQLIQKGIGNADNAAAAIQSVGNIKNMATAQLAIDKTMAFLTNVGYNSSIQHAMAAKSKLTNIERKNKMVMSPTVKQLTQIDPRKLTTDELNEYLELAPVLVNQLEGKDVGLIADIDIASFLSEVQRRQDEIVKSRLMKQYEDLGLTKDMSVDEMRKMISESKADTEEKRQTLTEEAFASREEKKREIITSVLEINRDELSNKQDIPAERKFVTNALLNIDESSLSTPDIIRLNQVITNIVSNDRYTGAGYFSKVSQGIQQIKTLRELVNRKGGFRPITYDNFITDKLKGTNLKSLSLTDKYLHLNTFEEVGDTVDEMLSHPIGNGYSNQKAEMKSVMDGLDKIIKEHNLTKDRGAIYRVGILGELNSYQVDSKRTKEQQFLDNKGLLQQSIEALEGSKNKYEQGVYEILRDAWVEVEAATSMEDLNNFLNPAQKSVYDYVQKIGRINYGRLFENNEMYGSAPMKEKANYVHRRYVPLQGSIKEVNLLDDQPIATSVNGVLGQAGTKEDVVVTRKLPKDKVIDYNIYKSFRLGLNETLNDVYTLGDRIKANYILNAPAFQEALSVDNDSGKRNLSILRDSIRQMVNVQRGVTKLDMDMYGAAPKLMNFFRQTFYSSAVGTLTAAVPQYFSSAAFTITKLNKPSSYIQSLVLFAGNKPLAKQLIQLAGSGTANRDLQGDAQLEDTVTNLSDNVFGQNVAPKIGEFIDGMNDVLFSSLKYGDRATSLHTWVAGYIDNLIDQGVIQSASEFTPEMMQQHIDEPNTMAATAAERMVSMSNNDSDASRKADRFVNKTMSQEFMNDLLYPVKKFAVSMNNKLWLGIRNVAEWDGGQAEGAKNIVGALASIAIFSAIRDFIINKYVFDAPAAAATAAMGLGDEEEDEQARLKMTDEQYAQYKSDRSMYKFVSEIVSDVILGGQNVFVEKGVKNVANYFWKSFGDKIQEERKAEKKYTPYSAFYVSGGASSMLGIYSKSAGLLLDLNSDEKSPLNVLYDVNKEVDADQEARTRRLLFGVGIPLVTQFGLPSADLDRLNNRVKRRVERVDEMFKDINLRDKKNKDYKKYHGGGKDSSSTNFAP